VPPELKNHRFGVYGVYLGYEHNEADVLEWKKFSSFLEGERFLKKQPRIHNENRRLLPWMREELNFGSGALLGMIVDHLEQTIYLVSLMVTDAWRIFSSSIDEQSKMNMTL